MKKILCPINFSETSYNGLDYAFSIANENQADLILLHSIHPGNIKENTSLFEIQEEAKDRLEMICENLASRNVHAYVNYGFLVKIGLAEDEIIKLIIDNQVDMIIMGSSGGEGFFFKSLSADIVAESSCPVIVVPENYSYRRLSNISYATDLKGQEDKLELVPYILNLAESYQAHVDILYIKTGSKIVHDNSIALGEELINGFPEADISFKIIEAEDIVQGILGHATKLQTDLIVMATYDKSMIKKLFTKSYTKEILGKSSIPVMALHKQE